MVEISLPLGETFRHDAGLVTSHKLGHIYLDLILCCIIVWRFDGGMRHWKRLYLHSWQPSTQQDNSRRQTSTSRRWIGYPWTLHSSSIGSHWKWDMILGTSNSNIITHKVNTGIFDTHRRIIVNITYEHFTRVEHEVGHVIYWYYIHTTVYTDPSFIFQFLHILRRPKLIKSSHRWKHHY